jgi:hypothetical protein
MTLSPSDTDILANHLKDRQTIGSVKAPVNLRRDFNNPYPARPLVDRPSEHILQPWPIGWRIPFHDHELRPQTMSSRLLQKRGNKHLHPAKRTFAMAVVTRYDYN